MLSSSKILPPLLVLAVLIECLFVSSAHSHDYRFTVQQMDLEVFVQSDASVRLKYRLDFQNAPGAHAIDVVDIGLPHGDFELSNMLASLNGQPIRDIYKSSYIAVGVEIRLGQYTIPAGGSGKLEFECTMPDMVFRDTTDKTRASLQIKPTWFDPELQVGRTELRVAIHLPPETQPDQVTYQDEQYKYDDIVLFGNDQFKHVAVVWQFDSLALSSQNPKLSVSFPQAGMERVVSLGPFGLFMRWFRGSQTAQYVSLGWVLICFAFAFFRFSHGTGIVLFLIIAGLVSFSALTNPKLNLAYWPVAIGLVALNESILQRRKSTYLPALATVEGGGIKRGLTAPQAAVLLEMPLGKILALVIFGLLKKQVIIKQKDDPLEVAINPVYVEARSKRREQAAEDGIVLHDYEHAFLDRLTTHKGAVRNADLSEAMGGLIKSVANRMKGFDLSDTKAYYQAIVKRACVEANGIDDVEQRTEVLDRTYEWILLDDRWIDLFNAWLRRGYRYQPRWDRQPRRPSGPIIVGGGSGPPTTSNIPDKTAAPTSSTSLGEVAGSFVGWAENTMGSFAAAIEPARLGLDLPRGGVVDLSIVDRTTANVLDALMKSRSSGRGGGGGGCACACAGCACACACAGGGR